jgi:hypothetical protein
MIAGSALSEHWIKIHRMFREPSKIPFIAGGRDFRFGSKADVTLLNFDVRF